MGAVHRKIAGIRCLGGLDCLNTHHHRIGISDYGFINADTYN